MTFLLPLFPLPNVVLFPGMLLPLHIFEERYRWMIRDVLDHDARFGLVLCKEYDPVSREGISFDTGTIAEIVQYELLEEGKYNVLVVGSQRFCVERYQPETKPYLQGEVVILEEETPKTLSKTLMTETADLFNEARRLTHKITKKDFKPLEMPDEPESLSFFIAEHLRGSLVLKQELLEQNCTKARLTCERDMLKKMVKTLAVRTQIEDAFGNL